MPSTLTFFYDILSPYSYLGFHILEKHRLLWSNVKVIYKPFLLGGIMKASENVPPASVPAKRNYLIKDLSRVAALWNAPIIQQGFPSRFPINTLSVQRILTVISTEFPEKQAPAMRLLWNCYWVNDGDLVQDIEKILSPLLSPGEYAKVLESSQTRAVKEALVNATKEAVDAGAFGAPIIICEKDGNKEMFFGSDRFDHIARFLQVEYLMASKL